MGRGHHPSLPRAHEPGKVFVSALFENTESIFAQQNTVQMYKLNVWSVCAVKRSILRSRLTYINWSPNTSHFKCNSPKFHF